MPTLADQIRARINSPVERRFTDADNALLAVLDQCDRMREDARHNAIGNTIWVDALVTQFESVIAHALGINPEETSC